MIGSRFIMNAVFGPGQHGKGTPLFYLTCGFIVFSLALQGIFTGRVWVPFYRFVYQAKDPGSYWWRVGGLFVFSLYLIGHAFFLANSN